MRRKGRRSSRRLPLARSDSRRVDALVDKLARRRAVPVGSVLPGGGTRRPCHRSPQVLPTMVDYREHPVEVVVLDGFCGSGFSSSVSFRDAFRKQRGGQRSRRTCQTRKAIPSADRPRTLRESSIARPSQTRESTRSGSIMRAELGWASPACARRGDADPVDRAVDDGSTRAGGDAPEGGPCETVSRAHPRWRSLKRRAPRSTRLNRREDPHGPGPRCASPPCTSTRGTRPMRGHKTVHGRSCPARPTAAIMCQRPRRTRNHARSPSSRVDGERTTGRPSRVRYGVRRALRRDDPHARRTCHVPRRGSIVTGSNLTMGLRPRLEVPATIRARDGARFSFVLFVVVPRARTSDEAAAGAVREASREPRARGGWAAGERGGPRSMRSTSTACFRSPCTAPTPGRRLRRSVGRRRRASRDRAGDGPSRIWYDAYDQIHVLFGGDARRNRRRAAAAIRKPWAAYGVSCDGSFSWRATNMWVLTVEPIDGADTNSSGRVQAQRRLA